MTSGYVLQSYCHMHVEVLDRHITYDEVFETIMSMSNGKAPGPDGVEML